MGSEFVRERRERLHGEARRGEEGAKALVDRIVELEDELRSYQDDREMMRRESGVLEGFQRQLVDAKLREWDARLAEKAALERLGKRSEEGPSTATVTVTASLSPPRAAPPPAPAPASTAPRSASPPAHTEDIQQQQQQQQEQQRRPSFLWLGMRKAPVESPPPPQPADRGAAKRDVTEREEEPLFRKKHPKVPREAALNEQMGSLNTLTKMLHQEARNSLSPNTPMLTMNLMVKHFPSHVGEDFAKLFSQSTPERGGEHVEERQKVMHFLLQQGLPIHIGMQLIESGYDTLETLKTLKIERLPFIAWYTGKKWLPGHYEKLKRIFKDLPTKILAYQIDSNTTRNDKRKHRLEEEKDFKLRTLSRIANINEAQQRIYGPTPPPLSENGGPQTGPDTSSRQDQQQQQQTAPAATSANGGRAAGGGRGQQPTTLPTIYEAPSPGQPPVEAAPSSQEQQQPAPTANLAAAQSPREEDRQTPQRTPREAAERPPAPRGDTAPTDDQPPAPVYAPPMPEPPALFEPIDYDNMPPFRVPEDGGPSQRVYETTGGFLVEQVPVQRVYHYHPLLPPPPPPPVYRQPYQYVYRQQQVQQQHRYATPSGYWINQYPRTEADGAGGQRPPQTQTQTGGHVSAGDWEALFPMHSVHRHTTRSSGPARERGRSHSGRQTDQTQTQQSIFDRFRSAVGWGRQQ
uniref:Uncharacterized protein n=1 Tax=Vitrella brassicaformis TaxID=1169539 RepID=A0A7S1K4E7_9ALVE